MLTPNSLTLISAKVAIRFQGGFQSVQIFRPRNLHRPQRPRGGRDHLNVEKDEPARSQMLDEMAERRLGGVRGAMKHGFAGETAAEAHAVNAPHQFARLPA